MGVLVLARFHGRWATAITVVTVIALWVGPAWLAFEGEPHSAGMQALLVITCALLGTAMRLAARGRDNS